MDDADRSLEPNRRLEDERLGPIDGDTEAPVDGETEAPVGGETEVPADGGTEVPVDGRTAVPADETEAPAGGGTALTDGEDIVAGMASSDLDAQYRRELVAAETTVSAFFRRRADRYRDLGRRLDRARTGETVDSYLAASVRRSAVAAIAATILCSSTILGLSTIETVGDVTVDPVELVPGAPLSVPVLAVAFGLAAGALTWLVLVRYWPRRAVARRQRAIDSTLPSAITFLFALTHGGTDVITAIRSLAEEEAYGETAAEFDAIVTEMDLFGSDLNTAVRRTSRRTPSDSFRTFLDGLLGVLESGGDVDSFLEGEVEEGVERALEEQERFVERLGLLSEVFVTAFVAAPLFLIVTMLVIGVIGGDVLVQLAIVVYVVLPLSAAGFLLLVDLLVRPDRVEPSPTERWLDPKPPADLEESTRYRAYRQHGRRESVLGAASTVVDAVRDRPVLGFAITVPVAIAVAAGTVLTGFVVPTLEAVSETPVRVTMALVLGPGIVATAPVALVYERTRRRERELVERFPDVLDQLANANRMGVTLAEAFRLGSESVTGPLGEELRYVKNDVRWNHDPAAAFRRLADRLAPLPVAPTLTIVAEGSRVSGDLHDVLTVAAEELRLQTRLESARRREVGPYLAIVFVGSLVYLLVIVVLTAAFLEPLGELAIADVPQDARDGAMPMPIADDVETYRALFYHSALVQGVIAGVLGGTLAEDNALGGLKYAIALSLLVTGTFLLV